MADATIRKNRLGVYQVRLRLGGRQVERSLHTKSRREADDRLGVIRTTLRHIEDGVLAIPSGLDPVTFIVSGGKLQPTKVEAVLPPAPAKKPMTLQEAGEQYLASFPDSSKESETLKTEQTHLKHLTRILGGGRPLKEMKRADLQAYVNRRSREKGLRGTVQRKTIKMELDTFRQIWDWAAAEGEVAGVCPSMNTQDGKRRRLAVNLPKERQKQPFKTWDEVQAVLALGISPEREAELWECLFLDGVQVAELLGYIRAKARHPWLYPMFAFAAFTGARISEICRAQVEDVQFGAGKVLLREKKKKQHAYTFRTVPLAAPLAEALQEWLARHPGGPHLFCKPAHLQKANQKQVPLNRQLAERHFTMTLQGGKWANLHGWHLFRHSFASNLARSGRVSQAYIDELMGHQTAEMRERYRHLFPDQVRGAVAVLSELYAGEEPTRVPGPHGAGAADGRAGSGQDGQPELARTRIHRA
jgi:integrase